MIFNAIYTLQLKKQVEMSTFKNIQRQIRVKGVHNGFLFLPHRHLPLLCPIPIKHKSSNQRFYSLPYQHD